MYEIDVTSTMCCGLGELDGIQGDKECGSPPTPQEIIFCYINNKKRYPYVIFTACDEKGCPKQAGSALARYIRKHKLGTVRTTRWKLNPNSGNKIQVFLWEPNYTNLKKEKT